MKNQSITIREAWSGDIPRLQALLSEIGLSSEGLLESRSRYWLAEDEQGEPAGVIGLELGDRAALLRSAGVRLDLRGRGIGNKLVQQALAVAVNSDYQQIYLFSTDAGTYWQRHRFLEVPVTELVERLPAVPQVKHYEQMGWLSDEIAWRLDLGSEYEQGANKEVQHAD